MNIKYVGCILLLIHTFLMSAQTKSDDNSDVIEIDITQLKTGYWHAENQTDSVYLDISSSKCYYFEKDSLPRKARMYAELTYVSLGKPQKVVQERTIIIEFDYLDTLPEPRRNYEIMTPNFDKQFEEFEWKNKEIYTFTYTPKVFIFKQLLPNKLILQERDSLKRIFIFNKLSGEKPNFRQIQINKLDTIAKKIEGFWGNEKANSYFVVEKPYISPENWLQFEPNLSGSSIVLSINPNDSVIASHDFLGITWEKDSEYALRLDLPLSKIGKYKIDFITDDKLLLTNDSLHIKEYYSELPIEAFPDSILRGLQNKAWCDTTFNHYEQKIDTTVFDFGGDIDAFTDDSSFVKHHGHFFDGRFHNDIFLEFFTFHKHYYFIQSTHGSIDLWEIIALTPNEVTLKGYLKTYSNEKEVEKLEIKTYFLHPQNSDYFEKGHRIRY